MKTTMKTGFYILYTTQEGYNLNVNTTIHAKYYVIKYNDYWKFLVIVIIINVIICRGASRV